MFTSIKSLRASSASPQRVNTVETMLKRLLGAAYSIETIFPVFLIGESNSTDDVNWVIQSRATSPKIGHLTLAAGHGGGSIISREYGKSTKAIAIKTLMDLYVKDLTEAHFKAPKPLEGPELSWLATVIPTTAPAPVTAEAAVDTVAPTSTATEEIGKVAEVAATPATEALGIPDKRVDQTISQAQNTRVTTLAAWATSKEKRQKFLETLNFEQLLFAAARNSMLAPGITDAFIKENVK